MRHQTSPEICFKEIIIISTGSRGLSRYQHHRCNFILHRPVGKIGTTLKFKRASAYSWYWGHP